METAASNKNRKFTLKFNSVIQWLLIPVVARSKSWVWGLWVRIPLEAWISFSCDCCVLSGRGLCNGSIIHPGESYWAWRVWAWSWNLIQEAKTHWGCWAMREKKLLQFNVHSYSNTTLTLHEIRTKKHETANGVLPDVTNRFYKSVIYLISHIFSR